MADKANPCTEGTLAVGTGDEGDVILRIAGSGFPGLPPLLCCSGPVGLAYLGAFVHGGTPLAPVHGGLFPGVWGDGKRFIIYIFSIYRIAKAASWTECRLS